MDFLELAQTRFSCRKFTDRRVEPEKIQQILSAAIAAPTAVNRQPYRIWVMKSEEAIRAVRSCTTCHFGANLFFVVGCAPEKAWIRPFDKRNYADVDASIAATHMMLEIQSLGLGTTWVGYFDAPMLKELCPEMAPYELLAIFPVGYPSPQDPPSERHFSRKPREELVETL